MFKKAFGHTRPTPVRFEARCSPRAATPGAWRDEEREQSLVKGSVSAHPAGRVR